MGRKHSLERRFISRLEKTIEVFGYISLETIVNSQLEQKTNSNVLALKKVYKIADIQRKPSPIPESFKEYNTSKIRRCLIE